MWQRPGARPGTAVGQANVLWADDLPRRLAYCAARRAATAYPGRGRASTLTLRPLASRVCRTRGGVTHF